MNDKPTTIEGWLNALPDGIREKAFHNAKEHPYKPLKLNCDNLDDALCWAFYWVNTEEKFHYWFDIYCGKRLYNEDDHGLKIESFRSRLTKLKAEVKALESKIKNDEH